MTFNLYFLKFLKFFFLYRFIGGELNACYNAVDRHILAGNGNKVALIHDSPQTSTIQKITYNELLKKISLLAGVLADMGVGKGDVVIIYMPLIPETIIAILATTRLGAVHSVVFGGKNLNSRFLKLYIILFLGEKYINLCLFL